MYLIGGFGNILFQLLAFNKLQKTQNRNIKLIETLTQKNFYTKILGWNIHNPIYKSLTDEKDFYKPGKTELIFDFLCFFVSKTIQKSFLQRQFVLKKSMFPQTNYMALMGYFQNLNNFSDNEVQYFCNFISDKLKIGKTLNRNVIHFRWGDSEWAKKNETYYKKIKQIIISKDQDYYVITDDKNKCINFFNEIKSNIIFVSNSEIDDFIFLSKSKNIYCAPSTFSWWASMINKSEKNIIMPKFFKEFFKNDSQIKFI